jgi:membrane protein DedA with SNARE-associated domain
MTPEREESVAAIVGTALWLIGFVVLAAFFRHDLQRHHATWWFWSCGLGLVLGVYGLSFSRRRRSR